MNNLDTKIRDFCKRFSSALEEDSWGNIDPYIFECIGNGMGINEDKIGEEGVAMYIALEKTLK